MKKKILVILLAILAVKISLAQEIAPDIYWISFTDKINSPHNIRKPQTFLSERSVLRRIKYDIPIDSTDLPLSPKYVKRIKDMGGEIVAHSKWLNGIAVKVKDEVILKNIKELSFVKNENLKKDYLNNNKTFLLSELENYNTDNRNIWDNPYVKLKQTKTGKSFYNYGFAKDQIEQLNGILLHDLNYKAQNILMAVVDAGFYNVDKLSSFRKMREENRLLACSDIPEQDTVVFDASYHGMKVLSTIVGELEDTIVGTAPKASILLYRTEDSESENMIEEIYWIKAAEAADSIGADIISTSLGYKDYDIKKNSYKVSDLNGIKSPMSRAVNMCAHKGMLPVMSAGNTGWGLWQRVTIPADADTLLSVAAVTRSGFCGSFSAKGPTPDGRLRPNVAARGVSAIVQSPEGGITYANGTSFACPVLAGMTACLLQAHNKLSPNQIIRSIEKNSSQYYNPEGSKGYGIPDFVKALIFSAPDNSVAEYTATCPNCITKKKSILLNSPKEREKTYELPFNISLKCTDLAGQTIINFHGKPKYSSSKGLSIDNWNMLNAGCYKFELEIIGNHFFGIYINSK